MDSLSTDQSNLPVVHKSQNGQTRISFVRYTDSITSTGENFDYLIEESENLRSWTPASVSLEQKINIGAGMERYVYSTEQSSTANTQKFLRIRVIKLD